MAFMRLQTTRSDGEVDTYHLKSIRRYVVGRGSTCEVRILDMRMSRNHFAFAHDGANWEIFDEGSTNGLLLNDSRLSETTALKKGDTIKAGNTVFTITGISEHIDLSAPTLEPTQRSDTADEAKGSASSTTPEAEPVDEKRESSSAGIQSSAVYVKLLGQRVGPLDRRIARELKKRELLGKLAEDDIAPYVQ